jgi:LytS/YehU family sensor histidine kinase
LTRIGRGLLDLSKERVDVRSIITSCVESIRLLAGERRHELTVELLPDPVWVEADAVRLEQVVTNLLTNAISYTDDGGQIRVVLERERDEVVLRVIDSGIGIEPDELARIFTLFVRGRPLVARALGGVPAAGSLPLVKSYAKGDSLRKALVRHRFHAERATRFGEEFPAQAPEFLVQVGQLGAIKSVKDLVKIKVDRWLALAFGWLMLLLA